ncbi:hypothetical protein GCM10022216_30180 [Sphingobacterium kyonggiense]|uniref:Uncharacterized protein n=1 Tax=Sphingobacterium kyonggiense TaxID=714075 RepID=A0ABP7Z295_9SPHI
MKDQDFDKLFSDKLKDFEENPPEGLWDNIEASLNKETKEKPVKRMPWIILSMAAALLLVFGISIKIFLNKDAKVIKEEKIIASIPTETVETEELQIAPSNENKEVSSEQTLIEKLENTNPNKKQIQVAVNRNEERNTISNQDIQTAAVQEQVIAEVSEPVRSIDLETEEQFVANVPELENKTLVQTAQVKFEANIYQEATPSKKNKQGLFVRVLNNLVENIVILDKDVRLTEDDEGTWNLNIKNSIAKTRN